MGSLMEQIHGYKAPTPLTDDRIIEIAKRGSFRVSLRHRDISLQKQCNALVRDGKLIKIGRVKREIIYKIKGN